MAYRIVPIVAIVASVASIAAVGVAIVGGDRASHEGQRGGARSSAGSEGGPAYRLTGAPAMQQIPDRYTSRDDAARALEAVKSTGKEIWDRKLPNGKYELLGILRLQRLPDGIYSESGAVLEYLKYPDKPMAPGWEEMMRE